MTVINPLFSTVALSPDGIAKVTMLRHEFSALLETVEEVLPGNSREISIIRTKLEEASFYAVKDRPTGHKGKHNEEVLSITRSRNRMYAWQ